MISSQLDYICKGPISKQVQIYRNERGRDPIYLVWGHTIQPTTVDKDVSGQRDKQGPEQAGICKVR